MKYLKSQRRWVGMATVLAGAGMITVHYIDYGWTAHLTLPDHGIAGAVLVLIGVLIGAGKPGTHA